MDFYDFLENTPSWRYSWLARQKAELAYTLVGWKASDFIKIKEQQRIINAMSGSVKKGRKQREYNSGDVPNKGNGVKWLSLDIRNTADQHAIAEYVKDVDHVVDALVVFVDGGYDVSLKRDGRGRPVAYGFLPESGVGGVRSAVSANGRDAYSALAALMYKLEVKLPKYDADQDAADGYEFS